uniref:Uncharacterized protein n=1 Tax=Arundo donax TaxID=35708 RepID=A0A0A9A5F8_ARUDO
MVMLPFLNAISFDLFCGTSRSIVFSKGRAHKLSSLHFPTNFLSQICIHLLCFTASLEVQEGRLCICAFSYFCFRL